MENKPKVRIRGKTNPVTGTSQPSSSAMKKSARAQTIAEKKRVANTSDKIEALRTQMLNVLFDNPQKFQKRGLEKLTTDIKGAQRLIKLENIK